MEKEKPSTMERHVQTILVLGITGLLTWLVFTTNESSKDIIRLNEKVAALVEQLKHTSGNDQRINKLELRVGILERQVNK